MEGDNNEHAENGGHTGVDSNTGPKTSAWDYEEKLTNHELWWRDHYDFLERRGYRLRPRYRPGWIPSWKSNGKSSVDCEDSIRLSVRPLSSK